MAASFADISSTTPPANPPGDLFFDSTGEFIGPLTTPATFSTLRIARTGLLQAGPDRSRIHFERELVWGSPFTIAIEFIDQRITNIELFLLRDDDAQGWENWNQATELARKAASEAWAEQVFKAPLVLRPFQLDGKPITPPDEPQSARHALLPFGEIASYYDNKGGTAFMRLKYLAPT